MRLVDADYLIAEGNKDGAYGYVSVDSNGKNGGNGGGENGG